MNWNLRIRKLIPVMGVASYFMGRNLQNRASGELNAQAETLRDTVRQLTLLVEPKNRSEIAGDRLSGLAGSKEITAERPGRLVPPVSLPGRKAFCKPAKERRPMATVADDEHFAHF